MFLFDISIFITVIVITIPFWRWILKDDILQEAEVNKKRPTFIKAKERVTHMQKKADSARKSLAQAIKAHNAHMDDIRELEGELQEVEKKRGEFEEQVSQDSENQGL